MLQLKHISRLICLLLTLNVFVLNVRAQDTDDEDTNQFDITQVQTTISKDFHDIPCQSAPVGDAQILPEHKHNKKFQSIKHISFKVIIPATTCLQKKALPEMTVKTPVLPKEYTYMYFSEINPPPPKQVIA